MSSPVEPCLCGLIHYFLTGPETLIDLLETNTFAEYTARPVLLRERWTGRLTVIDEVQKIPALSVHDDQTPGDRLRGRPETTEVPTRLQSIYSERDVMPPSV